VQLSPVKAELVQSERRVAGVDSIQGFRRIAEKEDRAAGTLAATLLEDSVVYDVRFGSFGHDDPPRSRNDLRFRHPGRD
jgi:hypothetical protein